MLNLIRKMFKQVFNDFSYVIKLLLEFVRIQLNKKIEVDVASIIGIVILIVFCILFVSKNDVSIDAAVAAAANNTKDIQFNKDFWRFEADTTGSGSPVLRIKLYIFSTGILSEVATISDEGVYTSTPVP